MMLTTMVREIYWQCFSKESHLHNQFHNPESELHNHACTDIYDIPT